VLATLLHNLGGLAYARGDDARAESLAREGLELRRRTSADRTQVAADAVALAAILERRERWAESEALHREALATWEQVGDSYEVAMTLNGLAAAVRFSGRPDEAEELFTRSLALLEAARGPAHCDTAVVRNNLGMLLRATGRADAALPLLAQAATDLEALLGPDHPSTVDVRANHERTRRELGGR
jgi:tetratricopeptide (TPR) repeat protein